MSETIMITTEIDFRGIEPQMPIPYAVQGCRVLASFLRADETGHVLVYNRSATPDDPHGGDPDGYRVATLAWPMKLGHPATATVLYTDLAYLNAMRAASQAAYVNED